MLGWLLYKRSARLALSTVLAVSLMYGTVVMGHFVPLRMPAIAGIPETLGIIIMGVFVASFAGTPLDTATRIQRYVITELSGDLKIKFLQGKYVATVFAVGTAAFLAFATGADGNGALKLWPMFGAVNQLLAALVLIVITIYVKRKGG